MNIADRPNLESEFQRKYQLLAKIGSGGMGDVFLGVQRGAVDFSRLVVIKRIHERNVPEEYAEANAKMFLNEASVIASLNHPHIVKIFDFLLDGSSFCIVMEYVEGETLQYIFSQCSKQDISFPVGTACSLIYDACNTLHYAHTTTSKTGDARNIIHRDIGLHNLMLDISGHLKIIDFGIAKSSINTDMTTPGMLKGNPSYMAPELFKQKDHDHRLDIYALGLCLYELITGKRAFKFSRTATVGEVIDTITNYELPPASGIVQDLPEGFDDVVRKAVAKNPEDRYPTAEAFGVDLKRVAGNIFIAGSDTQKWFNEKFGVRLSERREFEGKILSFAAHDNPDEKATLPSKLPKGFEIVSGISPPPFVPPRPRFVQTTKAKILAAILLLSIAGIAVFYARTDTAPVSLEKEEPDLSDNLMLHCNAAEARISVDGKEMGIIPADGISLRLAPNQQHEIRVTKAGYRDFYYLFTVPKNGTKHIDARLIKKEIPQDTSPMPVAAAQTGVSPVDTEDNHSTTKVFQHNKTRRKDADRRKKNAKNPIKKKPTAEEVGIPKRKIPLPDDNELLH